MLQSDWPRQHSGAVHGMLVIVTRPSSPDGLARETRPDQYFAKWVWSIAHESGSNICNRAAANDGDPGSIRAQFFWMYNSRCSRGCGLGRGFNGLTNEILLPTPLEPMRLTRPRSAFFQRSARGYPTIINNIRPCPKRCLLMPLTRVVARTESTTLQLHARRGQFSRTRIDTVQSSMQYICAEGVALHSFFTRT